MRRRTLVIGAGLALLAGGIATHLAFRRDLQAARATTGPDLSQIADTRHGPLEYAEAGSGPPFLMLHGTGGGFDQGLLFARRLVTAGYRVIAPSRFGYLRTPLPSEAGPEAEADAMYDLLDHLGITSAAIAGGSAGAIPAMAFAERHPDRTAALIPIVPALFIEGRPPVEPWGPAAERLVKSALRSDFMFWAGTRLARNQVIGTVLATDPKLLDTASPEEKARAEAIMKGLLPMSERADGLLYDNVQTNRLQGIDFSAIRAPALIISAEDDRYDTADNARWLSETIPDADLLIFRDGGHIWLGHDAELWSKVDAFLKRIGFA